MHHFDSAYDLAGLIGIYAACIPITMAIGLGMPTGLWLIVDIIIISVVGILIVVLANFILSALITFIRIRIPRLLLGAFIATFSGISIALWQSNISYWGAAIISFILIILSISISTSIYIMIKRFPRRIYHTIYVGLSLLLLLLFVLWLNHAWSTQPPTYDRQLLSGTQVITIQAENPSHKGPYSFQTLTYGTGKDLHRDEFAENVDMITKTVDGSDLIKRWSKIRELFWGFDKTKLPLNGRVWLPIGEGLFPLVLIVHGNHLMEDFSDDGYAYLGELLASKGFIAVSLDENFINYSVWSGGLSNDMELRSWVMLQHIEAIRELNRMSLNPLSSKVDMSNIALIGHSRGGQAAVLAAENLDVHDDIKAIIAIAPTDRTKDKKYLKLNHINYMVIQGSQDADVSTFTGDRQYERATIFNKEYLFKTSLYIERANHGQFNTTWGNMDLSLPTGLFLNKRDILDGENQRLIAQIYVSAFLETTLKHTNTYLPMFKDYRAAADWLPATSYRSRFEASDFKRISDFEEDHNIETTSIMNGSISADNMKSWKEDTVKDRQDSSKQNRSVHLSWAEEEKGSYELLLPSLGWTSQLNSESVLSFAIANITNDPNIDITIELESEEGDVIQNPIHTFMRIHPAIHTQFTKEPFLDRAVREGRYGESTEPVFQTFMISLKVLSEDHPAFNFAAIKSVRFLFSNQQEGSILLDDIGFY